VRLLPFRPHRRAVASNPANTFAAPRSPSEGRGWTAANSERSCSPRSATTMTTRLWRCCSPERAAGLRSVCHQYRRPRHRAGHRCCGSSAGQQAGHDPAGTRTARTVDLAVGSAAPGRSFAAATGSASTDGRAPLVRSIGKRAGIGPVHPHMLRAAFIMTALDAGVHYETSSLRHDTPIPAPPPSTTGAAKTSTDTPPTSSLPTSPADRPDPCSRPSAFCPVLRG